MWYVVVDEDGQVWDVRYDLEHMAEAYFEDLAADEWVDRVQLVGPDGQVLRDTDVDRNWLPRQVQG